MIARMLVAFSVLTVLFPISNATWAAVIEPQVLALIDSHGGKPLNCDGKECFVEISAFCMEPGRPGPAHETPYSLAEGAALVLVARFKDGSRRRIDAAGVRFQSQRGYSAVRMSVPQDLLVASGAESLAIEIGPRVVLLPKPLPSYQIRHQASEIEAALGPNRVVGERLVDDGGGRADGARLLSYLINALPPAVEVSAPTAGGLWRAVLAAVPETVRAAGRKSARRGYERCLGEFGTDTGFTLRECLQHRHDRHMRILNQDYWQSVGPES